MKTKDKILATVEIAIVLCSVVVVALPLISANLTTQKAGVGTVTAASGIYERGPLDVFGNANGDDIIDMRDTTYIKLVIFGKKPKTNLADANNDEKVSMLDIGQTKLVILGKEKELTIVDSADRIVTVKKPVQRVVLVMGGPEPMIILAKDKIVGFSEGFKKYCRDTVEKAGLMDIPTVGRSPGEDYEKIISLEPDLVLTTVYWVEVVSDKLPEEIPVVALDFDRVGAEKMIREFRTLGAILGEQGKANEAVNWIKKYEGIVEYRVEGLAPEEIITYYIETYGDFVTYGSNAYEGIAAAGCGGRNLVDGAGFPAGGYGEFKVSPEWVLEQDPDVIFCRLGGGGFEWTNEDSETRLNELLARPGWEELSAVKEGRVYLYDAGLGFSPRYIVLRACFAKWLHPDLFKDLDPDSIHKEYWKELLGIDVDLEGGVWTYPPPK